MSDERNQGQEGPEIQQFLLEDKFKAKKGVALGCGGNLALMILVFIVLIGTSMTPKTFPALYFGILLVVNLVIVVVAHRKRREDLVIGFAIGGSVAVLIAGLCWGAL